MRRTLAVGVVLAVVVGVAIALAIDWPPRSLWRYVRPQTPHQRYAAALAEGGLAHTALAADWLTAAGRALSQPTAVTLPFSEEARVDPARPASLGYAVTLKRGQKLDVQVTAVTDLPGQVFVDLFEPAIDNDSNRRAVASAAGRNFTLP